MSALTFSNGLTIDSSQIVDISSTQQKFQFPGEIGELEHLLNGRPSKLVIRLRDESTIEINAGSSQLRIHLEGNFECDANNDFLFPTVNPAEFAAEDSISNLT